MSIPIGFAFYSETGELLAERSIFTISYGQRSGDLMLLGRRLAEASMADHQRYVHPAVRYAVPKSAPDYMFDLLDPAAILPNKFKK